MIHLLIQQYTDHVQRISMFFNAMCLFSFQISIRFLFPPLLPLKANQIYTITNFFLFSYLVGYGDFISLSLSSSFPRIFFLSRLQLCLITSRNFRVEDFLKKRGRGKRNCSEELLKLGDSRSMMRYHENGKRYTFEKLQ